MDTRQSFASRIVAVDRTDIASWRTGAVLPAATSTVGVMMTTTMVVVAVAGTMTTTVAGMTAASGVETVMTGTAGMIGAACSIGAVTSTTSSRSGCRTGVSSI